MLRLDRMLFRLYLPCLLLALGGVVSVVLLRWFIPAQLAAAPLLAPLASAAAEGAPPAGLVFIGLSILVGAHQTFEFYRWKEGKAYDCHRCGGMLSSVRKGRYGPYCRCLACGKGVGV